jgi:hypothetical protein
MLLQAKQNVNCTQVGQEKSAYIMTCTVEAWASTDRNCRKTVSFFAHDLRKKRPFQQGHSGAQAMLC